MSLLDTQRELAKPVEEVARALYNVDRPPPYGDLDPWDNLKTWANAETEGRIVSAGSADEREATFRASRAAITRLRELGFINDIGLQAIRAEEAGERKNG